MYDHSIGEVFKDDEFNIEILGSYDTRAECEERESYFVESLNTYLDGLNKSKYGKGHNHESPNFTTLNYKYSDESKRKMSDSAKKRALREGFEIRSEASKKSWSNGGEAYRQHMSDVRKGRRLRKPKLSDNQVADIRAKWIEEMKLFEERATGINEERKKKNSGWALSSGQSLFSKHYAEIYGVSNTLIRDIILNKCRTKVLPQA